MIAVIVNATSADLHRVRELWLELHHHHLQIATYPTPTDDEVSWHVRESDYRSALENGTGFLLMAMNGPDTIGYAMVLLHPGGPNDTFVLGQTYAELYTLIVAASFRRDGLGTALFEAVEHELGLRAITELEIAVMVNNAEAVNFYRRHGARPVETRLWKFPAATHPVAIGATPVVGADDPAGRPIGASVVMQRVETPAQPWTPVRHDADPNEQRADPETERERARGAAIGVYEGPRVALHDLFALAEDSPEQLAAYLERGRVLVARIDDRIVGHLQLVPTGDPGTVEIKNMAVDSDLQGQGIGSALIDAARHDAMKVGIRQMIVATAAADVDNLRFYQRNGFRCANIERDAFTPATGYPIPININGILLRDRVWLDLELTDQP